MKIELKLFASLMRFIPSKIAESGEKWIVETEKNTTVNDLLKSLNIPPDEVKIIFINGVHAKKEDKLKDNDRLGVFPPVGGG